jgi:DNA polymerase I-like protein with 3'-5' exonuclease and polymerase domains
MLSKVLGVDLETTVDDLDGKIDNSPFNPKNKCVSAHFAWLGGEVSHLVFNHNEKDVPDSTELLRKAIAEADVIVAHNAKFDVLWLLEMGFEIDCDVYCTMIGEYILSKGQRQELGLKATAIRRDVTRKKSDLVDDLFKSGTGFEAMPLDTVIEYAEADVIACLEIYEQQKEEFALEYNESLISVSTLMNEMLMFLVEIERNGIKVDLDVLSKIKEQFLEEQQTLKKRLSEILEDIMGDTPINLNSGADMSKAVYSRKVINRHLHQQVWNIGVGPTGKPLYPPRMKPAEFARSVRSTTEVVNRTHAICCNTCDGRGKVRKIKKDGVPYKNLSKCESCDGLGAFFQDTGVVAGLRLNPETPADASINGFKTDKVTLKRLIKQARRKGNLIAEEFLTKSSRLNAVNTYLDSFVKGIETWTRSDGILHSNFNQCITATGRLSSSNPNFQNQPKRGFPVRKAAVSRFENGEILEADYAALEWRVAAELSRDPQAIEDIVSGKDAHKQTACIINQCEPEDVTKDMRQAAKAYSFAPLFGGQGNGEAEHVRKYFSEFFVIYSGLGEWHKRLMDGVLKNGIVQTPSGRQYFWPNARRMRNGRISNATQVVNYPVQGFSTGCIVPLACIRAYRLFKKANLRSKLILTVHDSIVIDCAPGELPPIKKILVEAMQDVTEEIKSRWGYEFCIPLPIEISTGKNWLDQDEIPLE